MGLNSLDVQRDQSTQATETNNQVQQAIKGPGSVSAFTTREFDCRSAIVYLVRLHLEYSIGHLT